MMRFTQIVLMISPVRVICFKVFTDSVYDIHRPWSLLGFYLTLLLDLFHYPSFDADLSSFRTPRSCVSQAR
jgi:hypothetical protein